MKLTEEQEHVIESVFKHPVVSTTAFAGTGKTTTCVALLEKAYEKKFKSLYLVFNKAMQEEAERRIGKEKAQVMTAHGLAYGYLARRGFFKGVKVQNLRTAHLVEWGLTKKQAFWLLQVFTQWLYSEHPLDDVESFLREVEKNHFLSTVLYDMWSPSALKSFLKSLVQAIESGKLPMPHDFYLKHFVEKHAHNLSYDLVILDEAQDSNPVFVKLLKNLKTKHLLMVGDPFQRIYAFRNTVYAPAFFQDKYKTYLTTTFRFSDEIAKHANIVLEFAGSEKRIQAFKQKSPHKERAIISRTNAELLPFLKENPAHVEFERPFEEILKVPLTFMLIMEEQSPELLSPYFKNPYKVLDATLLSLFRNPDQLENYVRILKSQAQSEDEALSPSDSDLITAYNLYAKSELTLGKVLDLIKSYLSNHKNKSPSLYLTTAHSAKGQEYKQAELLPSLAISEQDLLSYKARSRVKKIQQEVNLLYVAITRAGDELIIPDDVQKTLSFMQALAGKSIYSL